MSKNILIDTTNNIETRIAVTEDGKLDDFEIETNKKNAVKGDVYLAKITRIEPSLQAAFVDFGTNRNGFLPLTEIHPDYFKIPTADKKKLLEQELENTKNLQIDDDDDSENELSEPLQDFNEEALKIQSNNLGQRISGLEEKAFSEAGKEFNLASTKDLREIFFEEMNMPVMKKTPGGQPSTDESVLQDLARDYELPKILLEHRTLAKLKNTYTDSLPEQISPKTGRIHTSYLQAVTTTGRLSSADPNLQNIPIKTEEGRMIRNAFVAPKGQKLLSIDLTSREKFSPS